MLMHLAGYQHHLLTQSVFQEVSLDSLMSCPPHLCHLTLSGNTHREIQCCHMFVLKGWTVEKLGKLSIQYKLRKYELSIQDGYCLGVLD